jgi:hypothetical protein
MGRQSVAAKRGVESAAAKRAIAAAFVEILLDRKKFMSVPAFASLLIL